MRFKENNSKKFFLLIVLLYLVGCASLPDIEDIRGTKKAVRLTYNADIDKTFEAVRFGINHPSGAIAGLLDFDKENYRILARDQGSVNTFYWAIFLKKLESGDTEVDFVSGFRTKSASNYLADYIKGGLEAYLAGKKDEWIQERRNKRINRDKPNGY